MHCKYCFNSLNAQNSVCGICKIDSAKNKKELTKEEKKVAYFCKALHAIGFLAIIFGLGGIAVALFSFFAQSNSLIFTIANFTYPGLFVAFGFLVLKYHKWCYIGGIILWSLGIINALIEIKILSLLFAAVCLYYIASPTSKKIFYRQL